jgi:hypothetical protein
VDKTHKKGDIMKINNYMTTKDNLQQSVSLSASNKLSNKTNSSQSFDVVWIRNNSLFETNSVNVPTLYNPSMAMNKICGNACAGRCEDCQCQAGNCNIKTNSILT